MTIEKDARTAPHGFRAMLDDLAAGDPKDALKLGELVGTLPLNGVYGVMLFLATLPAFTIPGLAGALSGPLVAFLGLQLLLLRRRPWLPAFIARRGIPRSVLIRFERATDRVLRWLETLVRPRLAMLVAHPAATAFTGLQLAVLGVLLAAPIPFTNYIFGGVLLVYALALLERDGLLMVVAWVAGLATLWTFYATSLTLLMQLVAWGRSLA